MYAATTEGQNSRSLYTTGGQKNAETGLQPWHESHRQHVHNTGSKSDKDDDHPRLMDFTYFFCKDFLEILWKMFLHELEASDQYEEMSNYLTRSDFCSSRVE